MDAGLDDRTLRRIIALLVSLAVLAERAAGRSFPVRWIVLSILRYVEGVARDYLAETTGMDRAACLDDDLEPGSRPDDAALLAWRLRTLAAMFGALLPPETLPGWARVRSASALGRLASQRALSIATPAGCVWPAPDTS